MDTIIGTIESVKSIAINIDEWKLLVPSYAILMLMEHLTYRSARAKKLVTSSASCGLNWSAISSAGKESMFPSPQPSLKELSSKIHQMGQN